MIYFLVTDDNLFVKIGFTSKMNRDRINHYSTHYPYDLNLVLFIYGDKVLELEIQNRFSSHRKKNEWFYYSSEIQLFVEENAGNNLSFKTSKNYTKDFIENIRLDYLSGHSLQELADKHNKTKRSIQGILNRNKIRKRY